MLKDSIFKRKNINLILVISFIFLMQKPAYCEMQPSDWNRMYNSIERCLKNGAWEEARARLMYLEDVINANREYKRFPNLKELKIKVENLVNKNLELLYQKGQAQLNNGQIERALGIFKKIIFYNPEYKNVRQLLKVTKGLKNTQTLKKSRGKNRSNFKYN